MKKATHELRGGAEAEDCGGNCGQRKRISGHSNVVMGYYGLISRRLVLRKNRWKRRLTS
jgi:hypothetical protein